MRIADEQRILPSRVDRRGGEGHTDGILLEGGGHASLRVVGMSGTYYFCAAVMCSILLSLIVDVDDARDCTRVEGELL